jgi:hypothetical protein
MMTTSNTAHNEREKIIVSKKEKCQLYGNEYNDNLVVIS